MVAGDVLTIEGAIPIIMGANVGTTVTAMLAALATGESAAVTVAFTHLLFNLSAIAIIWPFERIRRIPVDCAEWLAARAAERWYVPAVFVGAVFFVAPLTVILATGALPDRKGDKSDIVAASAAAASAPADSATITVIGSDTLVILAKRWAEVYMAGAPGVDVQVNGGGSGGSNPEHWIPRVHAVSTLLGSAFPALPHLPPGAQTLHSWYNAFDYTRHEGLKANVRAEAVILGNSAGIAGNHLDGMH